MRQNNAVRWLVAVVAVLGVCSAAVAQKSDSKVKVNVTADKPAADGNQVVKISLEIEPGWHLYANPPGNNLLNTSATKVTFAGKDKIDGVTVDYPPGTTVKDKDIGDYLIYQGKVEIKATVKRSPGDGPLTLSVKVQACSEGADAKCLAPATVQKPLD